MVAELERYLFSVDDYHRMVEAGIPAEDTCVELIDGSVVSMRPTNGWHMRCVGTLSHLLVEVVRRDAFVSARSSVRLDDRSEPQPDITVLRQPPPGREPPGVRDALLLIEVSDTTLRTDLNLKARLYSRAGVPEYWVAAIDDREVFRHTDPHARAYRMTQIFRAGERVRAACNPTIDLLVDDIFA